MSKNIYDFHEFKIQNGRIIDFKPGDTRDSCLTFVEKLAQSDGRSCSGYAFTLFDQAIVGCQLTGTKIHVQQDAMNVVVLKQGPAVLEAEAYVKQQVNYIHSNIEKHLPSENKEEILHGSGSTYVSALFNLTANKVFFASLGDSRLFGVKVADTKKVEIESIIDEEDLHLAGNPKEAKRLQQLKISPEDYKYHKNKQYLDLLEQQLDYIGKLIRGETWSFSALTPQSVSKELISKLEKESKKDKEDNKPHYSNFIKDIKSLGKDFSLAEFLTPCKKLYETTLQKYRGQKRLKGCSVSGAVANKNLEPYITRDPIVKSRDCPDFTVLCSDGVPKSVIESSMLTMKSDTLLQTALSIAVSSVLELGDNTTLVIVDKKKLDTYLKSLSEIQQASIEQIAAVVTDGHGAHGHLVAQGICQIHQVMANSNFELTSVSTPPTPAEPSVPLCSGPGGKQEIGLPLDVAILEIDDLKECKDFEPDNITKIRKVAEWFIEQGECLEEASRIENLATYILKQNSYMKKFQSPWLYGSLFWIRDNRVNELSIRHLEIAYQTLLALYDVCPTKNACIPDMNAIRVAEGKAKIIIEKAKRDCIAALNTASVISPYGASYKWAGDLEKALEIADDVNAALRKYRYGEESTSLTF